MRVIEKTGELFDTIERITNVSFVGVEKPSRLALRYAFDNEEIFVSTRNGIQGYAIVSTDGGHPYIKSIAVTPCWRKQGIASGLLAEIILYYSKKNEERIDLTVNVDNPAQKLYFDHGFRAVRVLQNFYGETSGLRMRRKLC